MAFYEVSERSEKIWANECNEVSRKSLLGEVRAKPESATSPSHEMAKAYDTRWTRIF